MDKAAISVRLLLRQKIFAVKCRVIDAAKDFRTPIAPPLYSVRISALDSRVDRTLRACAREIRSQLSRDIPEARRKPAFRHSVQVNVSQKKRGQVHALALISPPS